jgi:hypothetical protein
VFSAVWVIGVMVVDVVSYLIKDPKQAGLPRLIATVSFMLAGFYLARWVWRVGTARTVKAPGSKPPSAPGR